MPTIEKLILSGSTDGRQILVSATGSPGTAIHTASTTSTTLDEVWLYATNNHTSDVNLTIQYGGTTSPNDSISISLPIRSGLYLLVPGLLIKGNATPLIIRAFAGTTNVISISGFINRITP